MVGSPRVVVVGTGVGGLAAAIELAAAGAQVTVVEAQPEVGGKMRAVDVGGALVDAGPTVLTMLWVFEELARAAGASLAELVDLERAEIIARHAWSDGTQLDLHADPAASADAIGRAFGAREAARFRAFARETARIYAAVEGPFIRSPRPSVLDLARHVTSLGAATLARIDAHRTMARALESAFGDPRLVQLFGRYATYVGGSPYEAPATLNLIAHVESAGVWRVRGGMSALARGLAALASRVGASVRTSSPVARVITRGRRAAGVELASGEVIFADAVVWNGDKSALGAGLAGADVAAAAPRTPLADRSLSALAWVMAARPRGFPLVHHNVFFSDDYPAEFRALFDARRVPDRPTVYVCAEDRGDVARDAAGAERFLLVVNAPATGDAPERWTPEERERCERVTTATLSACGLTLERTADRLLSPVELERWYPGTGGAIYGPRPKGPTSSLSREGSTTKVSGLYLAGGSVHPGAGVPMAATSGRLAAARVLADLASTPRSRPAATSGTTSTARAPMGASPSSSSR